MVDAALPHPPTAPSPRSCSQDDIEESTVRLSRWASAVNVSMVLRNGLPTRTALHLRPRAAVGTARRARPKVGSD